MQLTATQKQAFESFGFVLIPGFLDASRVEALRNAVSALKAKESGEPNTIKHTGRVVGMFHKDQDLLDLFDDPQLAEIALQLLGKEKPIRFLGDEYVSFSAPADWHQDMGCAEPFESLKFGFYLDDLSRGGCLRVVPGSHRQKLADAVAAYRNSAEPKPEIATAFPCVTQPGDLLVFDLKIWHQGTANPPGTHRRVIFWSLGQDDPKFSEWARTFHERLGRGKENEPWPELLMHGGPRTRAEYLDVYPKGSVKQSALRGYSQAS